MATDTPEVPETFMNELRIRTICQAHRLPVARLDVHGDVLVIVPESLDHLPSSSTLASLVETIRPLSDCRYVTLGIGETGEDTEAPQ